MSKEEIAQKRRTYKDRVERVEYFIGACRQKYDSPEEAERSFMVLDLSELLADLGVDELADCGVDAEGLAELLIKHFDAVREIVDAE